MAEKLKFSQTSTGGKVEIQPKAKWQKSLNIVKGQVAEKFKHSQRPSAEKLQYNPKQFGGKVEI